MNKLRIQLQIAMATMAMAQALRGMLQAPEGTRNSNCSFTVYLL